MRPVAEETVAPYASSHPLVRFNLERITPDASVKIDPGRLAQILSNLILNSIDAMHGAGDIELQTDFLDKRQVRYCRISVKDSGGGIAESQAARIFTPYFTTKAEGTGLGLAIVERLVQDHGGAVWFSSAEGAGATFYLDLPAAET